MNSEKAQNDTDYMQHRVQHGLIYNVLLVKQIHICLTVCFNYNYCNAIGL